MARPARVRIRSRKPWVFARRRLFGWKVRLLTVSLHHIRVVIDAAAPLARAARGRTAQAVGALGRGRHTRTQRYGRTWVKVKPATPRPNELANVGPRSVGGIHDTPTVAGMREFRTGWTL
jgi:hypothetical protein